MKTAQTSLRKALKYSTHMGFSFSHLESQLLQSPALSGATDVGRCVASGQSACVRMRQRAPPYGRIEHLDAAIASGIQISESVLNPELA